MILEPTGILKRVSYQKVLMFSFLAIVAGFGVAGFLLPKVVRLAMKMVRKINFSCILLSEYQRIFLSTLIFNLLYYLNAKIYDFSQQLRVTPGTLTRGMFEKVPFPLDFRLYLFNITNPDEVMSGGKPKLQQIGPLYFE